MFPDTHSRWPAPAVAYAEHTEPLKTPAYRHLAIVAALFLGAIFAGTTAVVNVFANNQIEYKPAISESNSSSNIAAASPVAPQPQQNTQPAVATEPAKNPDNSTKVQEVLNTWVSSHPGQQWSVSIQGLEGSSTQASLNPTQKFDPASVYKLYFTYTLFQSYTLDSLSKNFVSVAGKGQVSMKDCLDLMIKNSDNPYGEAMGNKLGWGKTTNALKNLGIFNTNLNNPSGITTTSADANIFLQKLYNGLVMDPDERQYILDLMQQQKYRLGIPAGCSGCIVSNKTGDLGFVRHDVGIVQYPGGSYTLAIMTSGVPYGQIAQLTSQIQTAISSN